jgi:hypothetical protein
MRADFASDAKTINYTLKTVNHTALAVPLLSLVNAAEPKLDARIKNDQLRFAVLIEGRDGYTAVIALAELMPNNGNRDAWVALDMDGKPLSDIDSPANLIVPADQKPERWVHGIKTIRIVDVESAATRPIK